MQSLLYTSSKPASSKVELLRRMPKGRKAGHHDDGDQVAYLSKVTGTKNRSRWISRTMNIQLCHHVINTKLVFGEG